MQTVKLEVNEQGRVRVLYQGFVGDKCLKEAEKLMANLKSLGVEATLEEMKMTEGIAVQNRDVMKHG